MRHFLIAALSLISTHACAASLSVPHDPGAVPLVGTADSNPMSGGLGILSNPTADNELLIAKKFIPATASTYTFSVLGEGDFPLKFTVDSPSAAAAPLLALISYGGGVANVFGQLAGGSQASPTPVEDSYGVILGLRGYDGSSFVFNKAAVHLLASETWGVGSNGTRIQFETTAIGTSSRKTVASLDEAGLTFSDTAFAAGYAQDITTPGNLFASSGTFTGAVSAHLQIATNTCPTATTCTVSCPAGLNVTSGGGNCTGNLVISAPSDTVSWTVACSASGTIIATALCSGLAP